MLHPSRHGIKTAFIATFLSLAAQTASADVLTSVRPVGLITAAIADGVTDTQILLPDGASPHDYALKPSDLKKSGQRIWLSGSGRSWKPSCKSRFQLFRSKNRLLSVNLSRSDHYC